MVMSSDDESQLLSHLYHVIRNGDVTAADQVFVGRPDLVHHNDGLGTWLHCAARGNSEQMIDYLVGKGLDANAVCSESIEEFALEYAINRANLKIARKLLESGANPRLGVPVIAAITSGNKQSLELVKLLESFGADIHLLYPYGDEGLPMNALAMATIIGKADVVEYLRSRNARLPEQYSREELNAYASRSLPRRL